VWEKQPMSRRPKLDPPPPPQADYRRTSINMNQRKVLLLGRENYPVIPCKVCSAHRKSSEIWYIHKFCVFALHRGSSFEKYHSVKHCQTHNSSYFRAGFRSVIYREFQNASKSVLKDRVWERRILIKGRYQTTLCWTTLSMVSTLSIILSLQTL
jgi:hypothetical protein